MSVESDGPFYNSQDPDKNVTMSDVDLVSSKLPTRHITINSYRVLGFGGSGEVEDALIYPSADGTTDEEDIRRFSARHGNRPMAYQVNVHDTKTRQTSDWYDVRDILTGVTQFS